MPTVCGYTNCLGSDQHHNKLSEARAKTVQTYLKSLGVKSATSVAQGKGKRKPVSKGRTLKGLTCYVNGSCLRIYALIFSYHEHLNRTIFVLEKGFLFVRSIWQDSRHFNFDLRLFLHQA